VTKGTTTKSEFFDWTEERVTVLRACWNQGLSASQIAIVLGGELSRCAVLGKVHRIGLPGRQSSSRSIKGRISSGIAKPTRIKEPTQPTQPTRPVLSASVPILKALVVEMKKTVAIEEPPDTGEGIAHEHLTPHVCQWPINEGSPWRFCGGKKVTGSSYCKDHAIRAYDGPPRSWKKPPKPQRVMEESEAA
jgi:GcrA cell cycle regulator